jgi:AMP-binding enzyme
VTVIKQTQDLGFQLLHVYGMTEQHGVNTVCVPQEAWAALSADDRLLQLGREGVRIAVADEMMVADPQTLKPVPRDGKAMGEVLFRGNLGMKGYLKNPQATAEVFADAWHHSGDLAVVRLVDQQQARFRMLTDERHRSRIEAHIDAVQNGASQRHAELGLEHRRNVRGDDGHGVAAFDSCRDECAGQPPAAIGMFGPGVANVAVDDGCLVREYVRGAVEEPQGRHRLEIGGTLCRGRRRTCPAWHTSPNGTGFQIETPRRVA